MLDAGCWSQEAPRKNQAIVSAICVLKQRYCLGSGEGNPSDRMDGTKCYARSICPSNDLGMKMTTYLYRYI